MTGGPLIVDGVHLGAAWHGPPPSAAPTLVFLHEGLGSVSLWRDFPRRLADGTGFGALVYSRRGYGRSDTAPPPWPVAFMHTEATVLGRVLDVAEIRDAVLVGHSDGASIALVRAGRDADPRVRMLLLEAPHVFVEDVTVASITAIAEAAAAAPLRERLRRHHGSNADALFRAWTGVWLDPAFRSWSIAEHLPAVRVPTLVIQGADDEYGTLAQVDAVRDGVAGSVEALVLDRCGHSPHRDRAEATLAAMTDFLRRHPDGSGE